MVSSNSNNNMNNSNNIHPLRLYNNPLLYPAAIGDVDTVRQLLNDDPELLNEENYNLYPIHIAHPSVIPLMLERGVDLNVRNSYGRTALNLAIESGNKERENLLTSKIVVNKPHRITLPSSLTDPVSRQPVPLSNATFLVTDLGPRGKVYHIYHRNSIKDITRSPMTRKQFSRSHILNVKNFLTDKQIESYRVKYAKSLARSLRNAEKHLKSIMKKKTPESLKMYLAESIKSEMKRYQTGLNAMKRKSKRRRITSTSKNNAPSKR